MHGNRQCICIYLIAFHYGTQNLPNFTRPFLSCVCTILKEIIVEFVGSACEANVVSTPLL